MIDINELEAGMIIRTCAGNWARVLFASEDGAFVPIEYLHDGSGDLCADHDIIEAIAAPPEGLTLLRPGDPTFAEGEVVAVTDDARWSAMQTCAVFEDGRWEPFVSVFPRRP
jgi:hypothetical protein